MTGYRTRGGRLTFSPRESSSLVPMTVSCKQCAGCRLKRSLEWAIRIMHEARAHERTCFLTLTYSDEHLPEGGTLVRSHFPGFMKRLRQREHRRAIAAGVSPARFRYFQAGEYGDRTMRPHHHAAFFGEDFREDSEPWATGPHPLWTNKVLDADWSFGRVVVGSLSHDSAQYIAKYILKKRTGPEAEAHYAGREPEFVSMSKGIGADWFEAFKGDVFPRDEVVAAKHALHAPAFYMAKLKEADPVLYDQVKKRRREKATDLAWEELRRRDEVIVARQEREIRDLPKFKVPN